MTRLAKRWPAPAICAAALLLAGCDGVQSMFQPNGPAAAAIVELWWVLFWVSVVVFVVVTGLLLYAIFARGDAEGEEPPLRTSPDTSEEQKPTGDRRDVVLDTASSDRTSVRWVLAGGGVVTAVIIAGLLVFTLQTLDETISEERPPALTIAVTGWMWWWEVEYIGPDGEVLFETANEIHIPTDRRVRLRLTSADVIHSFWVPQLAGKLDMIPGRVTQFSIEADDPGVYRGQCAEYCGTQHAHMAFLVIAQPPEEFEEWAAHQSEPAPPPSDPLAALGKRVFLSTACSACHAVRGTPAVGNIGPDLTHVASRRTLAAGMLPNTKGHMAGWIANPQQIKPDADMPAVPLEPRAFRALVHYMMTLE